MLATNVKLAQPSNMDVNLAITALPCRMSQLYVLKVFTALGSELTFTRNVTMELTVAMGLNSQKVVQLAHSDQATHLILMSSQDASRVVLVSILILVLIHVKIATLDSSVRMLLASLTLAIVRVMVAMNAQLVATVLRPQRHPSLVQLAHIQKLKATAMQINAALVQKITSESK